MKRRRNNISGRGKITPLVTITAEECGGNVDKMIRKFTKTVKKEGIIEEARERSHFIKPTVVRTRKKRDKKRLIEKALRRENRLINTRDNFRKRRK
jgi:ribosomal protein S21